MVLTGCVVLFDQYARAATKQAASLFQASSIPARRFDRFLVHHDEASGTA
jgi:hypothetical protein